jgi:peptide deformylase
MAVELEVPPGILEIWAERNDGIVKYPDEALFKIAKPVAKPTAATRELVERMKTAMMAANGVGLAAPQLGVSERVIIYKLPEEDQPVRVIINPKIISKKGEQIGPEGCLSIPLLQGEVKRANEVIVKGLDILGRPLRRRASEFESRVIQHECDHLQGLLFIELAEPGTLHWLVGEELEEADDAEMKE